MIQSLLCVGCREIDDDFLLTNGHRCENEEGENTADREEKEKQEEFDESEVHKNVPVKIWSFGNTDKP